MTLIDEHQERLVALAVEHGFAAGAAARVLREWAVREDDLPGYKGTRQTRLEKLARSLLYRLQLERDVPDYPPGEKTPCAIQYVGRDAVLTEGW